MDQEPGTSNRGEFAHASLLSLVLEHSLNAVIVTASDSTIEYVNPAFERMTGWSREEAVGQKMSLLKSGETPREVYQELWDTVLAGRTWRGVLKNRRRDGTTYVAYNVITPILGDRNGVLKLLAVQEDVTARAEAEDAERKARRQDPTTGLVGRQGFVEALEAAVRGAGTDERLALILLDLDGFRLVNETHGHATGDRILGRVAEALRRMVEAACAGALLGYLGGDEFAILVREDCAKDFMGCASRAVAAIQAARHDDLPAWCTASAGVVLHPDDATTASGLLARADAAVYVAKGQGGNRAHRYVPEDRKAARSRLLELDAIRKALAEGRFVPYFQPILDIETRTIRHFEALARMVRPDGSVATPADFIETAERFQVVGEIDRAVARQAMEVQAAWARRGHPFTVSMNLAGHDIGDVEILVDLRAAILETRVNPSRLVFEITETEAIRDMDRARCFVERLRAMGTRFSLDDFGAGFGSFRYLKDLPVDYLKIDGAFIRRLPEDDKDQLFVRAFVDVARGLGIVTVAEFVEDVLTLKLLRAFGVEMAQGFVIGRPAPEPDPTVRVAF